MSEMSSHVAGLSAMEAIYDDMYSGQPGALIPILQKAQDVYGFLPPEVLQWIADRPDTAVGKVYGVATFYSQFYLGRRGQHGVKVCDGMACHVQGSPSLVTAVHSEYGITPGETTEDGELSLGSRALAPVTVLDDQVMGRMRPEVLLCTLSNPTTASNAHCARAIVPSMRSPAKEVKYT